MTARFRNELDKEARSELRATAQELRDQARFLCAQASYICQTSAALCAEAQMIQDELIAQERRNGVKVLSAHFAKLTLLDEDGD
jgi:hypothetical protein